ncbi:hypothetical protein [Reyranella sp.]|uniref:hypothetical protein n=1 Tax=Reyranella sp. TaxID=1929291 RepID=UPI003BAB1338
MTLRAEYRLGHSEYNAFLFAALGEDEAGLPLTVLSALTRLGLDPWQEAARLADLPREVAARQVAEKIGQLPAGNWTAADVGAIAERLVGCLPARSVPAVPLPKDAPPGRPKKAPSLAIWVVCGVLLAAVLAVRLFYS